MVFSFWRSPSDEAPISIPAIGLDLFVRMPPTTNDGTMTVIETINAPGFGPPRHRHEEVEVFRVLEGRYLYEVDGKRFHADAGDLVSVPGGVEQLHECHQPAVLNVGMCEGHCCPMRRSRADEMNRAGGSAKGEGERRPVVVGCGSPFRLGAGAENGTARVSA